ncbi:MAG TPA: SDR family oxidoreductase [Terracidiphilus sp.]|nr:SDR family oxidoreductase [Terracidiphilus sp.]
MSISGGRVAVITGATSSIGSAMARALSAAGYALVLNAPSHETLIALRAQLKGPCLTVAGSLSVEGMPQTLLTAAMETFGGCDVCFNNGGLLEAGTIDTIDVERICSMVRVNVEGAFRLAYTFLQHFARQGHGHLVNTSNVLAQKVRPTLGAYAATKYALEALTEALRMELSRTDIHISSIEPGLVRTGRAEGWEEPPAGRLGVTDPFDPDQMARMMLYILEKSGPALRAQRAELVEEPALAF